MSDEAGPPPPSTGAVLSLIASTSQAQILHHGRVANATTHERIKQIFKETKRELEIKRGDDSKPPPPPRPKSAAARYDRPAHGEHSLKFGLIELLILVYFYFIV
jgi:hypothetical protein